ncbi:hypothetical protein N7495_007037 [Penicillium taxi]|uniref:uncharacterized protein n=1 Tax=Penicillium taxi TaxID=168475 RepID=UPI002545A7D9|nr:uncharacterized protein N7495_007037 [Penicillium taxi]KAJ5895346.1 hypothetical protein N7495_007037 [Penicillium taxi]
MPVERPIADGSFGNVEHLIITSRSSRPLLNSSEILAEALISRNFTIANIIASKYLAALDAAEAAVYVTSWLILHYENGGDE